MAVSPVIEIEVKQEAWLKLQEAAKKYQDVLDDQPEQWRKVDKQIDRVRQTLDKTRGKASKGHEEDTATMGKWSSVGTKMKKLGADFRKEISLATKPMNELAKASATIAGHLKSATGSLLKWAGLGGALGGVLGLGGLFGLERLAGSASDQRRAAMGLGTSIGGRAAFSVNYGRAVNTDSVLQSVSDVQHSYDQSPFNILGITNASQKDPADLAAEVLRKARELYKRTGGKAELMSAYGIDRLVAPTDLRRLGNMSDQEFNQLEQNRQRDTNKLNVNDPAAQAWQDLDTQLTRASKQIENTFVLGLAPLAPDIESISKSFGDLVQSLLQSDDFKGAVKELEEGLRFLADEVGSEDFKKSVLSFEHGVKQFTDDIITAASWLAEKLHWLVGGEDNAAAPGATTGDAGGPDTAPGEPSIGPRNTQTPAGAPGHVTSWFERHASPAISAATGARNPNNAAPQAAIPNLDTGMGDNDALSKAMQDADKKKAAAVAAASVPPGGNQHDQLNALESKFGLPKDSLWRVYGIETNYGRDPTMTRENSAHAMGPFQFTPAAAQDYGISDRNDFGQSSSAAAKYMSNLLKKYQGDIDKALASYNWGPGNVDKDVAAHGDKWKDFLPQESANYIAKYHRIEAASAQADSKVAVSVNVNNNTGGNAAVQMNQVRFPV